MGDMTVTAVIDQDAALAASAALVEHPKEDASFLHGHLEQLYAESEPVCGLYSRQTRRSPPPEVSSVSRR